MYRVHIIGNVPYVGFATYRRATVKIRLYFKGLMIMWMFCIKKKKKKKKKKKNGSSHVGFILVSIAAQMRESIMVCLGIGFLESELNSYSFYEFLGK
jgi:hypothetical protein